MKISAPFDGSLIPVLQRRSEVAEPLQTLGQLCLLGDEAALDDLICGDSCR